MQDAIILYENGKAIGGEGHPTNASDITFDNSNTNLVSENVEGAIKEVNSKKADASDLTSIFETGSTASQAISAGTYFYLNGTLVRAKTDIANGATFTLNTNYEVVTKGALNDVLAGLGTPIALTHNVNFTVPQNGMVVYSPRNGTYSQIHIITNGTPVLVKLMYSSNDFDSLEVKKGMTIVSTWSGDFATTFYPYV